MPNWITHTITASDKVIKRFLNENGEFDFNTISKMPDELDVEDGSVTWPAIACYVSDRYTKSDEEFAAETKRLLGDRCTGYGYRNSPNERELQFHNLDALYELGKKYVNNWQKYHHLTWYSWCRENWGTKWNASDPVYTAADGYVTFDTAWSAPIPIFIKICELFPEEDIAFSCEYEDGDTQEFYNNHGTLTETV